jgi:hypothetical protein
MDFKDAFIGGMFGIETLSNDESLFQAKTPFISIISIRFAPDINLVKETIKENFLKEQFDIALTSNANDFKIVVDKAPKKWNSEYVMTFSNASYVHFEKDAFLTIQIRDESGRPNEMNIALLRHFIKKLQDNKIEYEIW